MGGVLEKLKQMFWGGNMELVVIGLENAGKTTLVNQICEGDLPDGPTIGLNIKQFKKGNVNMKVWDLGGQVQYRSEWGRYIQGTQAIVYVLDGTNVNFYLNPK